MDQKFIELVAGAVLPPVIDIINSKIANATLRYAISMVICLALGAAFNFGQLNPGDILASGAIIFTAAQTVYKTYWANSGARTKVFGEQIKS